MVTSNLKQKLIAVSLSLVMCTTYSLANASKTVREVYQCNLKGDAQISDVIEAASYWDKQLDKLKITGLNAFMWTPFKTRGTVDFLWFSQYKDINEFGEISDLYYNSEEGASADAKFNELADCRSSALSYLEPVITSETQLSSPVVISSYACVINANHDMQSVVDLNRHIAGTYKGNELYKSLRISMSEPFVSSSDYDLYYFGVHDDFSTYSARVTDQQSSESVANLNRHIAAVMTCDSSLWRGQRIRIRD